MTEYAEFTDYETAITAYERDCELYACGPMWQEPHTGVYTYSKGM